eukprot:250179_1
MASRQDSIASLASVGSLDFYNSCELNDNDNISKSDIKRLFFIWFNSISNDNSTINLSQFSTILNRIFSSSITALSQSEITEIFNILNINNKQYIYFNQFLSETEDTFTNTMAELLQNDPNAQTILRQIPQTSKNNPMNDTLQKILHDQAKELISLKNWILQIGLPSQKRINNENCLLQESLSISLDDKQRMNMKLKLLSEVSDKLHDDKNNISKDYSQLDDDYKHSIQENHFLKSINETSLTEISKLKFEMDTILKQLEQQKQKNKQNKITINSLTKVNNQLHQSNETLTNKNEKQMKEINRLSNINNQLEVALDITTAALEQKNQEIETLKSHHMNDTMLDDIPSEYSIECDENLEKNMNPLKLSHVPESIGPHRRSYVFRVNETFHSMTNVLDSDNSASPNLYIHSHSKEYNLGTDILPFNLRKQSIVSLGGGQKMHVYNSRKHLDLDDMKGEYKKLYHDETRGVDLYVLSNEYDPNEFEYVYDELEYKMEESLMSINENNDIDGRVYDYDNIELKQLKNKCNVEMQKLKNKLNELSNECAMEYAESECNISTSDEGNDEYISFKLCIQGKNRIYNVSMLENGEFVIDDTVIDESKNKCTLKGKIMGKSTGDKIKLKCKIQAEA